MKKEEKKSDKKKGPLFDNAWEIAEKSIEMEKEGEKARQELLNSTIEIVFGKKQ